MDRSAPPADPAPPSVTDSSETSDKTAASGDPDSPHPSATPDATNASDMQDTGPGPAADDGNDLSAKIDLEPLLPKVEAAVLTSDRALTAGKIAEALDLPTGKPVQQAVDRLNVVYAETGRAFRIESVAGGYQVLTLPEHADVLAALHKTKGQSKLTAAALETLAIVAYKQPVLRAELESIRGVACGETLRSLMERHLIKIVGRAEEIGRPMLYGTTKRFLEVFGLASLKDLPKLEDLQNPAADA